MRKKAGAHFGKNAGTPERRRRTPLCSPGFPAFRRWGPRGAETQTEKKWGARRVGARRVELEGRRLRFLFHRQSSVSRLSSVDI